MLVEASIELVQLPFRHEVDDSAGEIRADACRALALQLDLCFRLRPVDEISAAFAARVAHVAKGDLGVVAFMTRIVMPIEETIDEQLSNGEDGEEAEEAD